MGGLYIIPPAFRDRSAPRPYRGHSLRGVRTEYQNIKYNFQMWPRRRRSSTSKCVRSMASFGSALQQARDSVSSASETRGYPLSAVYNAYAPPQPVERRPRTSNPAPAPASCQNRQRTLYEKTRQGCITNKIQRRISNKCIQSTYCSNTLFFFRVCYNFSATVPK